MKYLTLGSLAVILGLAACTPSQHTNVAPSIPLMVEKPQEIITSTGVIIRPYDHPDIERKSLPSP